MAVRKSDLAARVKRKTRETLDAAAQAKRARKTRADSLLTKLKALMKELDAQGARALSPGELLGTSVDEAVDALTLDDVKRLLGRPLLEHLVRGGKVQKVVSSTVTLHPSSACRFSVSVDGQPQLGGEDVSLLAGDSFQLVVYFPTEKHQ